MGRFDHKKSRLPTREGAGSRPSLRSLISAPVGPIHRSNGQDLQRSEGFSIVPSIDSCAGSNPNNPTVGEQSKEHLDMADARSNNNGRIMEGGVDKTRLRIPTSSSTPMVRRLSASYRGGRPPVGNPVTASENKTTTRGTLAMSRTTIGSNASATKFQSRLRVGEAGRASLGSMKPLPELPAVKQTKGRLSLFTGKKSNSTFSLGTKANFQTKKPSFEPTAKTATSDIEIKSIAYPHAPPPKPRLTKSRTLAALTNLTASLSRTSLVSDRKASSSSKASVPSVRTASPAVSTLTPFPVLPEEPPVSSQPNDVTSAQPSAYWSGRYLALHDRYKSEANLTEAPMRTLLAQTPNRITPRSGLTQSNTTVGLTTLTSFQQTSIPSVATGRTYVDDEPIAISVFRRLEELCTTPEARESLRAWQLSYARKINCVKLLPPGETMDGSAPPRGEGVVARFLARKSVSEHTDGNALRSDLKKSVVSKKPNNV
ncbi:hypothetical protein BN1723_016548, partial [Verticillium longisporum]